MFRAAVHVPPSPPPGPLVDIHDLAPNLKVCRPLLSAALRHNRRQAADIPKLIFGASHRKGLSKVGGVPKHLHFFETRYELDKPALQLPR